MPPLGMVDEVLTIKKCGATSRAINAEVNAFFEQKKLKLAATKCVQIHVGTASLESGLDFNEVPASGSTSEWARNTVWCYK